VEELLAQARRALDNKDWIGGASQIQEILDQYGSKVMRTGDETITYRSYREICHDILRALSPEGMTAYRTLVDEKALELLTRGTSERSPLVLRSVVTRYSFSSHAPAALAALGEIYLERGELEEARYALQRAVQMPPGSLADVPRTYVSLAYCCRELGDPEGISLAQKLLTSRHAAARVRFAGRDHDAIELVKSFSTRVSQNPAEDQATWPMIGGDAGRNRPLPPHRTESPLQWMHASLDGEPMNRSRGFQSYRDQTHHSGPVYPVHPVVGADTVIFHNGYRVQCMDLYVGKSRWTYESPDADERTERLDTRQIFSGVLASGVYFANLEVTPEEYSWEWLQGPVLVPIPMRKLFAIDVERGRLLWTHRGAKGRTAEEASFLRRLSISSPPLVVRDTVFAVGSLFEGKIHCYACAFDARDGTLLWSTLICTGQQELNMFGRPLLEHVPSAPSEDGDTLYFSTNLGLMAAVDSRLGSIRWITEYDTIEMPVNQGFHFQVRRFVFSNRPPVVSGDRIIVAPLDSERMYCFDSGTGQILWSVAQNEIREGATTIVGEEDGIVVVAGNGLTGIDLLTGQTRWSSSLGPRNRAAGLGGIGSSAVLSSTLDEIAVLDVTTGRDLAQRVSLPGLGPGNLLVTDRFLVLAGSRGISVCYRWEEVFEALKQRISSRPMDPMVYLEVGNVYRQGKEHLEATRHYARALELARQDPSAPDVAARAVAGLFSSYMALGDQEWEARRLKESLRWYEEARDVAHDDDARLQVQLAFIRYHEATGNGRLLVEAYERILSDLPRVSMQMEDEEQVPAGLFALMSLAEHHERLGRPEEAVEVLQRIVRDFGDDMVAGGSAHSWAATHIAGLIEAHGPELYEPFETQAQMRFERASRDNDVTELRAIVQEYPNSSVVQPCLVYLAQLLSEEKRFLDAVAVLRRFLVNFPESPLFGSVLSRLSEAYSEMGHVSAARRVARRSSAERVVGEPRPMPSLLHVPPFRLWVRQYPDNMGMSILQLTGTYGTSPRDRFLFQSSNRVLSCASAETGDVLWALELGERLAPEAQAHDSRLYVHSNRSAMAIDLESGELVWKTRASGALRECVGPPETLVLLEESRDQAGLFTLKALEAVSGNTLWSRRLEGQLFTNLVLTEDYAATYCTKPFSLVAVDPLLDTERFSVELGGHYMSALPLRGNRLLSHTHTSSEVRLFDLEKGAMSWEVKLGTDRETIKGVVCLGDRAAILLGEPGNVRLTLLGAEKGKIIWTTELPAGNSLFTRPVIHNGPDEVLFLNRRTEDMNYRIMAIAVGDGRLLWESPPLKGNTLPRQVLETEKYVVVERNYLDESELVNMVMICNKWTGEIEWQWEHRGNYTSEVALVGDRLLISLAGKIEAYGR
jgi:outer membrane protein assembly factor BamB